VRDMVRAQAMLVDRLGIETLFSVAGGSLGGMQVLQWALDHPDDLASGILVCASARLTAQNIAFSAVARAAIMRDEHFHEGDYYRYGERPEVGLSLARMMAHITYLSETSMREKFGRRIQDADAPRFRFGVDFQVESYLEYQGESFLNRFDANSYLYLTRVMDYFDPFADLPAAIARLKRVRTKFLVVSFDTDWRFDTKHSLDLVRVLQGAQVPVTFREIASPHGHDSFLLEVPEYHRTVAAFLGRVAAEVGAAN
jgi:homoserine O-acetyltransferase